MYVNVIHKRIAYGIQFDDCDEEMYDLTKRFCVNQSCVD